MRTTAIMNQKGGTGKTVTSINLAAILARDYANRILLVDADSQANLTEFVTESLPDGQTFGGYADLLRGRAGRPAETKLQNVRILHADETLMAMDVTAAGNGVADPMALAEFLAGKEEQYEHVIIDCPPAFSAGAMAALIAADDVVIPLKLDAFGMRGMANLLEQIRNMRRINPGLEVAGILPTMTYRTEQQHSTLEQLKQTLAGVGLRCFHPIRRTGKVDDMTFAEEPLIYSSPKSGATRDYKLFTHELLLAEGLLEGGDI